MSSGPGYDGNHQKKTAAANALSSTSAPGPLESMNSNKEQKNNEQTRQEAQNPPKIEEVSSAKTVTTDGKNTDVQSTVVNYRNENTFFDSYNPAAPPSKKSYKSEPNSASGDLLTFVETPKIEDKTLKSLHNNLDDRQTQGNLITFQASPEILNSNRNEKNSSNSGKPKVAVDKSKYEQPGPVANQPRHVPPRAVKNNFNETNSINSHKQNISSSQSSYKTDGPSTNTNNPDTRDHNLMGTDRLKKLELYGLPGYIHKFNEKEKDMLQLNSAFLGKGGYGSVSLVTNQDKELNLKFKNLRRSVDDRYYDNKFKVCYKKSYYNNNKTKLYLEYEILILSELFHKNIVELLGYYHEKQTTREGFYYMLMPFGGDSLGIFMKQVLPIYTNRESWVILQVNLQIQKILEYLHIDCAKEIIHRDMKPDNLLVYVFPNQVPNASAHNTIRKLKFIVRACDFGLAKEIVDNDETVTGLKGTLPYMAPEIIKREARQDPGKYFTDKVDIYATGQILQFTCTKIELYVKDPTRYPKMKENDNTRKMEPNKFLPALPEYFPDGLRELALLMIHYSPEKRPDAQEIRVKFENWVQDDSFIIDLQKALDLLKTKFAEQLWRKAKKAKEREENSAFTNLIKKGKDEFVKFFTDKEEDEPYGFREVDQELKNITALSYPDVIQSLKKEITRLREFSQVYTS